MVYDEMSTVSKMKMLTVHESRNPYTLSLNLNFPAVWTKFDTFISKYFTKIKRKPSFSNYSNQVWQIFYKKKRRNKSADLREKLSFLLNVTSKSHIGNKQIHLNKQEGY